MVRARAPGWYKYFLHLSIFLAWIALVRTTQHPLPFESAANMRSSLPFGLDQV